MAVRRYVPRRLRPTSKIWKAARADAKIIIRKVVTGKLTTERDVEQAVDKMWNRLRLDPEHRTLYETRLAEEVVRIAK